MIRNRFRPRTVQGPKPGQGGPSTMHLITWGKTITWGAALLALAGSATAQTAQAPAYDGPVAVVVSIPIPPSVSRAVVEATFRKQAPGFQALPGLKQKYFTVNSQTHRAGGIYLWANAAAAQAFYTDTWKAQVQAAFGAPAELTWFDAPLIIQGKAGMAP